MPIFYFHPENKVAQKLAEQMGKKGFLYTNRGELEFKLQNMIAEAGYDIWPTFHTMLGSLAGTIQKHISQSRLQFNPDDELDRHTIKLCKSSATSWSFMKIINGPQMSCVIGYCSTPASTPFNMGSAQMAQKGLIRTSHIPMAV